MAKTPKSFKAISVRFSSFSSTYHQLFVKEHSVRNQSDDKLSEQTLFILNVPPYATEESFKRVFSCAGPVRKVTFQSKPDSMEGENSGNSLKGFKVAYIVYEKPSSVQRALNLKSLEPLSTNKHPIITGVKKWAKEYNDNICDHQKLYQYVGDFMKQYDAAEEKRKRQEKQKDDGGWTIVTRKGRRPGRSRKESVKNKILKKSQKGEKRKHLTDFYPFQKRESKMNHLVEMRRKYEEDKKTPESFKAISVRFSSFSSTYHQLFVKEHSVRNQSHDKLSKQTLFILNVPPYATEESFKRVFSCAGPVRKVTFQSKPDSMEGESSGNSLKGFKVAYIVYEKPSSVQRALNLKSLEPLSTDKHPIITGVKKWAKEYNDNICDHQKLYQYVGDFMKQYDAAEEKRKRQEKQKDDGGWTIVTRKGRRPGRSRKESVKNKILEKSQKGEKRKHLTDFYTFQKRESKMNHLVEMRRKYEEDKKKVNAMKLARKFRPFK